MTQSISAGGARISGPEELVQAVPYLIGFHPTDSLVLVGLRADRTLLVTARLDLSDAGPEFVEQSIARIGAGGARALVAAIYRSAGEVTPDDRTLADRVQVAADASGCRLDDVLLVGPERWWSVCCADSACCDSAGSVLPVGPSPYTAAAIVDGMAPLADRAALEALLAPAPDVEREELRERLVAATALPGSCDWRELRAAARAADDEGWAAPDDETVIRLALALRTTATRDAVWLAVDERRVDGRALWRELARRLPAPYDAAPAFLYGWAAWRRGNGALALIAAERAVAAEPSARAGRILLDLLYRGLDPYMFPSLRRSA